MLSSSLSPRIETDEGDGETVTYGVSSPVADFALSLPMAAEWESENLAAILHRTTEVFVDANLPGVSAELINDLFISLPKIIPRFPPYV